MSLLDDLKELEAKATLGELRVANGCDQYLAVPGLWIASTIGVRDEQGAANTRYLAASWNLVRQSLRGEGDYVILPRVPSEEDVERIALGLVNAERANHGLPPCRPDDLSRRDVRHYLVLARAAYTALTEGGQHDK